MMVIWNWIVALLKKTWRLGWSGKLLAVMMIAIVLLEAFAIGYLIATLLTNLTGM